MGNRYIVRLMNPVGVQVESYSISQEEFQMIDDTCPIILHQDKLYAMRQDAYVTGNMCDFYEAPVYRHNFATGSDSAIIPLQVTHPEVSIGYCEVTS